VQTGDKGRGNQGINNERKKVRRRNTTNTTFSLIVGAAFAATAVVQFSGNASAQEVLPEPELPFRGHVGQTSKDSQPGKIAATKPAGAPNVPGMKQTARTGQKTYYEKCDMS
jgi:hypothetical protein